jgi:hypothetical protein
VPRLSGFSVCLVCQEFDPKPKKFVRLTEHGRGKQSRTAIAGGSIFGRLAELSDFFTFGCVNLRSFPFGSKIRHGRAGLTPLVALQACALRLCQG